MELDTRCGNWRTLATRLSRRDVFPAFLLGGLAMWLAADSVVSQPFGDAVHYLAMAREPSTYGEVPGRYAQRALPSLVVWMESRLFGWNAAQGFQMLSAVAFQVFLLLFYVALRGWGVSRGVAFGTAVFMAISAWPVPYSLGNIYQACDALAYPVGLLVIMAAVADAPVVAAAAGIAGVAVRQQLFVLAFGALTYGYLRSRRRIWLAGAAGVVATLGLLVTTGGQGGAADLWAHTGAHVLRVDSFLEGVIDTRLPVLLSPFLLLLVADARRLLRWAVRYWWVAVYVVVSVSQPLFAYDLVAGPSNAQRLAMIGIWPLFLAAGLRLDRLLTTEWARRVYIALPVLYGTNHLVSLQTTYPSPLGHRSVMNIVIVLLVLADRRARGVNDHE